MKILILDDDQERHDKFAKWFRGLDVRHVYTVEEFQDYFDNDTPDSVFLDHDLNTFFGSGSTRIEITGKDAAKFLCTLEGSKRPKEIFVHSWNYSGAEDMMQILKQNGYKPIRWVYNPYAKIEVHEGKIDDYRIGG